ncbi:MAG TPA: penicillin-binding protein 2, partial [Halanaerobiales bacterium]|nr:penicillin-binding protein 2 [Halanaerobiales bacterium]
KKIFIIKLIILLVFVILILRAGQLQLIMGDYYYQLSEGNRLSQAPIAAPRGWILDRNENVLVSNKLSYNLYLLPNEVPPGHSVDSLLEQTSDLTSLEAELLKENYNRGKNKASTGIILKRNISAEILVIIEENSKNLPGIVVKEASVRDYIHGNFASHILGYMGEINTEELRDYSKAGYDYAGGDVVGKTGLEKQYETVLRGINGIERFEVNSVGNRVQSLGIKPPEPGNNLILNIDLELQKYIEDMLFKEFIHLWEIAEEDPELHPPGGAAVILMDPNNGAIIAMVSIPDYDPNMFAKGISEKEFQELSSNKLKPLENRPIRYAVNPGSIFKLITGTAAIEFLGINADSTFVDKEGVYRIGEWEYRNWNEWGEGELNFTRAIARSNNIVFYELGHRLYNEYRGEKLAWTARQYGFGSISGLDLPGEVKGLVPDNEWKLETEGTIWYPGNSLHLAIGQIVETTPLQLITMLSSIANGGKLYQPFLVDKITDSEGALITDIKPVVRNVLPFEERTLQTLRQGMIEATNASYGTASSVFRDFPVKVAGKTGTAQTGRSGANHAWFTGFAPADDPEIAVLIFLEDGNSSTYALPIAADILKKYFGLEEIQEVDDVERIEGIDELKEIEKMLETE